MNLFERGLLFLDEKQNGGGGSDNQDADTSGSDDKNDGTDDSTSKKTKSDDSKDGSSGDSSAKTQDKTDDKTSTSKKGKDDADKGDDNDVDNDTLTKASAKVADKYRKIRTKNSELESRVTDLSETEAENVKLREQLAIAEEKAMKATLAHEFNVDPKLLGPVKGTEEELRIWLETAVGVDNESTSGKDNKKSDTKTEDNANSKTDDKSDDKKDDDKSDKSDDDKSDDDTDESKSKNLDNDRPKRKNVDGKMEYFGKTTEEIRAHALKNI